MSDNNSVVLERDLPRGKKNARLTLTEATAQLCPGVRSRRGLSLVWAFAVLLSAFPSVAFSAQTLAPQQQPRPQSRLVLTVLDENGIAVPSAHVTLTIAPTTQAGPPTVHQCRTDFVGRCEFGNLQPGVYQLRAEKEGFYVLTEKDLRVGETEKLEVRLNHQQEFVQRVDVVYSPPRIDPTQTTSKEELTSREITDLPYNVTRDIRYALPLLPRVLQDGFGQLHIDGADSRQTFDQMDGFNINTVASGAFTMRVNVDALRSVEVDDSRYPAEFGKASGGILSLRTAMGDDHFRFSGTDFLPSLQDRKGALHWSAWTPRASFSGPLRKGKAWFLLAPDGEYNVDIINELPSGQDEASNWRISNLAKAQVNVRPGNILTASVLLNKFRAFHDGLSRFDPIPTTVNLDQTADLFTLKDQIFLSNGMLFDAGVAESQFHSGLQPMGDQTYVITPDGTSGNFFESSNGRSRRIEAIANLILPPAHWAGRHELKIGTDIDRLVYHQSFARNPFLILRENGTLAERATFVGNPAFARNNAELSGYVEDRWSPSERLLVEPGLRLDRDEIVRDVLVSPRLASTYLLGRSGNTKLVGGIGLYYDATSLRLLTSPLTGQRVDYFYDSTGQNLAGPPLETSFQIAPNLKAPRFLNWSAGIERKLPASIDFSLEFVQKRGHDGSTFINQCSSQANCFSGLFELESVRRDKYDAVTVKVRRTFKEDHVVFAAYTRSSSRSNAVLDFSLENPVFSQQAGGPLPWDTPNRFQSWGFVPLRHKFDLAYILDLRDGFPFNLVNQDQQLVGPPGSRRFPKYFSLNLALERRVVVFGYQWSLRAGFDDITNRHNPFAVDNNVDSPHFLAFSAQQGRALTARIRLVGRK